MGNKTGLITPFFMLLAGAIAAIIMYVRGFELTRMLYWLLAVLIIFYIIGDIARYIYSTIRPRIIPSEDLDGMVLQAKKNSEVGENVVAFAEDGATEAEENMNVDGFMSEDMDANAMGGYEEGYSDEQLEAFANEENQLDGFNK